MTGPFVTVLTATGRGAVATVRVWGDGAVEVADRAFRPNGKRRLVDSPAGRLRVGRVGAGLGDEVVAVVVGDEVEVQCHGGPEPVRLVVEAMVEGGARHRDPFAWARHSSGSRIKAEAMMALADAPTLRSAEILMDQSAGALDEELRGLLTLDPETMLSHLDILIDRAKVGERLVDGWRVVLAGRPNVGKSRLLNALAGYDRAIVAPTPGTTRDVVTFATALDGWPVELADTAGLRATDDPIEAEGVARARSRQRSADLVLVVLDRSESLADADFAILADHPDALVVANKADLPGMWPISMVRHGPDGGPCRVDLQGPTDGQRVPRGSVPGTRAVDVAGGTGWVQPVAPTLDHFPFGGLVVSAEQGDGLDALIAAIAVRLVPSPTPPGSGVPFRSIHSRRLRAIRERLASGDSDRAKASIRRWVGS